MSPHSVDKLLVRAVENITAAQQARERSRPDLAIGNITCARDILAAIHDAHHAVDAPVSFQTQPQSARP